MIGNTLARCRITAALGAGGMGEVWKATDEKRGREAKVLTSLNHTNIAHLYGLKSADGLQSDEVRSPAQIPRRGAGAPLARDDREVGAGAPLARNDNEVGSGTETEKASRPKPQAPSPRSQVSGPDRSFAMTPECLVGPGGGL